jgi:ACS family tartrate transporter-like MFS transporter
VWLLVIPYFAVNTVGYAYNLWAPTLLRDALGTSNTVTGTIFGAIALLAAVVYRLSATLSDRRDERCGVAALGLALGFAGCAGMAILPQPSLRVAALVVIGMSAPMALAPFWCLPTKFLRGPAAAAGIALISAIGSSGGFFGPTIVGFLKKTSAGESAAFFGIAAVGLVGSLICVVLRRLTVFRPKPVPIGAGPVIRPHPAE